MLRTFQGLTCSCHGLPLLMQCWSPLLSLLAHTLFTPHAPAACVPQIHTLPACPPQKNKDTYTHKQITILPALCLCILRTLPPRLEQEVWSNSLVVASFYGPVHSTAWWVAAIVSTAIPAFYCFTGGMRASLFTDVFQVRVCVNRSVCLCVSLCTCFSMRLCF